MYKKDETSYWGDRQWYRTHAEDVASFCWDGVGKLS
jgi:hypothetical protein